MAADDRWYFTKEELDDTPSRRCGIDADKELSYRQQGAKLIQDMGQRLQVNQLSINTAIVYMHRFYMFHTFVRFHRNAIAPAALFLAAKVEEQPRKLEHVIKVSYFFLCSSNSPNLDIHSPTYAEKAQELVMNENILLQTLGFDVAIDHPHTYVVKCFQMVRVLAGNNSQAELPQTSYFMATNSLHMTTMCLQYKPAVVACVCIDIVCRWSGQQIQSIAGNEWYCAVDPSVTPEILGSITSEFMTVLAKFPNKIKKFIHTDADHPAGNTSRPQQRGIASTSSASRTAAGPNASRNHDGSQRPGGSSKVAHGNAAQTKTVLTSKEYTEKKEKERRERTDHREKHGQHPVSASGHPSSVIPSSHSVSRRHDNQRMPPPPGHPNKVANSSSHRDGQPKREHTFHHAEKHERLNDNPSFPKVQDRYKPQVPDSKQCSSADISNRASLEQKHERKLSSRSMAHEYVSGDVKSEPSASEVKREHIPKDVKPEPVLTDIKSEYRQYEKPLVNKVDLLTKLKHSVKEDVKPVVKEESRTSNSFGFNNNSFNLMNLLHPTSSIPPEEIFDNESEVKVEAPNSQTIHAKLKTPPRTTQLVSSSSKHKHSSRSTIETQGNRLSSDNRKPQSAEIIDRSGHGNGVHHSSKSNSHKKEMKLSTPIKIKNSSVVESTTPPLTSRSQNRTAPPKDTISTPLTQVANNIKMVSGPSLLLPSSASNMKVALAEKDVSPTASKIRVDNREKFTSLPESQMPVVPTNLSLIPSVKKEHKSGHSSHSKHKDKKKHKSKDKHKEKDSKDHKKSKKHKHKDKDKHKKEKSKSKTPPKDEGTSGAAPLKITIFREKSVYAPDNSSAPSHAPSSVSTSSTSISPLNTPGSLKITIPKSRIHPNNAPTQPAPTPLSNLYNRDVSTAKVKLKIPKEKLDRDARKRDRSPSELHYHPNKHARINKQVGNYPRPTSTDYQNHNYPAKPEHNAPNSNQFHSYPNHPHAPVSHDFTRFPTPYPPVNAHTYPPPQASIPMRDPYYSLPYTQFMPPVPAVAAPHSNFQPMFSVPPPGYNLSACANPPLPNEPPPVNPPPPPE